MTTPASLPFWASVLVSLLVLLGSTLALLGAIGLLKFKTFYERVHAPTLSSTLGLFTILAASMIYFSLTQTRPVVHEILLAIFVSTTTPVTFLLLVQSALYRDRFEGRKLLAELSAENPRIETSGGA